MRYPPGCYDGQGSLLPVVPLVALGAAYQKAREPSISLNHELVGAQLAAPLLASYVCQTLGGR